MMVELLAGPLVGGAHKDKRAAKNWGNLVIAINPALLGDAAYATARTRTRARTRGLEPRTGRQAGSQAVHLLLTRVSLALRRTFYKSAGEVLERVRNAERLPGVTEILIPGQREVHGQ